MVAGMALGVAMLGKSSEAPKFDDTLFFNALLLPIILEVWQRAPNV